MSEKIDMNSKFSKIVTKFIFHLPFAICGGLILVWFIWKFDPFYWQIGLFVGVIYSLYYILVNINDYNAFEDLEPKDYLESRHRTTLPNDINTWEKFNDLLEKQFEEYTVDKDKLDEVTVKVQNSIVKMKREKEGIELLVKREHLSFLPDRGKNFKMFRRIISALESAN